MTFKQFDELTNKLLEQVLTMRNTKGKEYANSDLDRLKNFTDIAEETGTSPLIVWQVYFKKHIRAIDSFIKRGETLSNEGIEGRFVDAITYLLLGYGLIIDAQSPTEAIKYNPMCAKCVHKLNDHNINGCTKCSCTTIV